MYPYSPVFNSVEFTLPAMESKSAGPDQKPVEPIETGSSKKADPSHASTSEAKFSTCGVTTSKVVVSEALHPKSSTNR